MTSLTVDSAETAWGMFLNPIFVRQQATQSVGSDLALRISVISRPTWLCGGSAQRPRAGIVCAAGVCRTRGSVH